MPDGGPVLLDGDDFDRLRTVVRRAESYPQNMRRLPRAAGGGGGSGLFTLRVTNGTPDGNGYYAATITVYDTVAAAYSDYDAGFLLPMNGEKLFNGKRYGARAVGPYSTGQAYQVVQGAATIEASAVNPGADDPAAFDVLGVKWIKFDEASGFVTVDNTDGSITESLQAARLDLGTGHAHAGILSTSYQVIPGTKNIVNLIASSQLIVGDFSGTDSPVRANQSTQIVFNNIQFLDAAGVPGGISTGSLAYYDGSTSSPATTLSCGITWGTRVSVRSGTDGLGHAANFIDFENTGVSSTLKLRISSGLGTLNTGQTGPGGGGDSFVGGLCTLLGAGSLTVGASTIAGGAANGLLYDNGGVVGEIAAGTSGQLLICGSLAAFKTVSGSGATITLSSAGVLTISAIAAASLVGTDIATVGTVTAGTWNATTIAVAHGGTGQTTAYAAKDALTVKGADIASAATTDLSTATGEYVHVTGTTTITALGTVAAGAERVVEFTGILILTHNGTSLILPGAANITTAAGDLAIFRSEGSGNWRCVSYERAAAPPISGTNTGDQTITLTGNVTGSGTGSFATTIAAGVVTNAMLAGSIDLTAKVTGILPTANGGTGIAFFTAAGPTTARIYTFPDAACTILTTNAVVTVAQGGTGLGTLTAHAVYVGNGTSALTALAVGATNTVLHGSTGANPAWSAVVEGDLSLTDITTANVSSTAHGLAPKFPNNTTTFLRGDGTYATLTAAAALWPPRFVAGLNLVYTDGTHIVVKAGSAIDSTNAVNMTLASDTTINLGASGLNGVDVLAGSGTATSSSTAVVGTSSNFTTAFGTRALSGTVTNTGTACVGSGTKFLSQVSVNDLIGTAAAGYKQVTAIADDTHLTLLATFTASALAVNCIEQPFFSQSGAVTPARVTAIADDTHLTADRAIGASGVAWASGQYGTGSYPGGAVNTYLIVWFVVQSGTTGTLLSNQRTTPQLASVTSYRRIGEVELDTIGNIIRFTQRGDGLLREMQLEIAQVTNNNRILSAGTATTFTTVVGSGVVPPTATDLFLALTAINSANAEDMYVRPRNSGSSAVTSNRYLVTPAANQYGSLFLLCPCDGAQGVEYIHSIANGTGYLDCLGWRSLL